MNFSGILFFVSRAAGFALAACALYALLARARGRWPSAGRLLFAFYFAALIQITVLRGGVDWARVLCASRQSAQWTPLKTTLAAYASGAWPFLYHVGGNLAWFAPLGLMLRRKAAWRALLAGAILSLSIEALQWLFMTGVADVDDVIINALGALLGRLLAGLFPAWVSRRQDASER